MHNNMESNNWPEILSIKSEPISLVTINNDCKQLIFDYLELKDLVNVAETSKQLNTAVSSVFKRKYGIKKIVYGYLQKARLIPTVGYDRFCKSDERDEDNCLIFKRERDELMFLKVLRNFGHTMVDIEICFCPMNHVGFCKGSDKIDIYLNKYCTKSLKKLALYDKYESITSYGRPYEKCKSLFEDIENPFPNVTDLKISSCILGPKLFTKLFPNLQSLCLNNIKYKSSSVIQEHLPNLQKLALISDKSCFEVGCSYEGVVIEMIKLNPQLENLHIFLMENCGPRLVQYISEYLPVLKYLRTSNVHGCYCSIFPQYGPFNFNGLGPFNFNNVMDFHFRVQGVENINLFRFSKLQRVSLSFDINFDDIHLPLLNFISGHKQLTSIELYGPVMGNLDRLFESEHVSSNVVELSILQYQYRRESSLYGNMCSVLRFLERSRSLEKLVIKGYTEWNPPYQSHLEFPGHLDAIASHSIEYRIISDRIITCKCSWCTQQKYIHKKKSMELTVKKTAESTFMKYICTFRDERNVNTDGSYYTSSKNFTVIECSKSKN